MLCNMSKLLTGDILKALCDMGHGDTMVIADGNFPADSVCAKVIRCPGLTASSVFEAIAPFFPLDFAYTEHPAEIMELTPGDVAKGLPTPEIWGEFAETLHTLKPDAELGTIERFAFYEKARKASFVILTGEERIYGNLLLTKGVVL